MVVYACSESIVADLLSIFMDLLGDVTFLYRINISPMMHHLSSCLIFCLCIGDSAVLLSHDKSDDLV